jgi:hypothetical protein
MQTLTCSSPTLSLILPDCLSQVTTAMLKRPCFEDVEASIATNNGRITVSVPQAKLRKGVWILQIEAPDCGCYETFVHVDVCAPPAFEGVHHGDGTDDTITPVCCPNEPDLCA